MSTIHWTEAHTVRSARWHSESAAPPPGRVVVADDRMKADTAYRLACEGTAMVWRGDYHNARQLLRAMNHRLDRKPPRSGDSPAESFHLHRRARSHRARVLGKLLVLLEEDHSLVLRRAPDVRRACTEAYGPPCGPSAVSLSELLGVIGARQWREKGVEIPALDARIHPHYGVFSPLRGEYVDLVAQAPLSGDGPGRTAFDLGTGTGVLAAVLAHRGIDHVVATDINPRALSCARDNIRRLDLTDRIEVVGPCLFPEDRADLVVCNPPWIPAHPTSVVEQGVYDPNSTMLRAFLKGLPSHLTPDGEAWLILSDLAEHLGLRTPHEVPDAIEAAGLKVRDRFTTKPHHPRASNPKTPLHTARAAETTSLWRLTAT
ncbi:methylase [Embleya scabrispora]|uniref:Methylase n=1 Tax=Embleya scabrispora TaxID=159449 RepID=A0A1T3P8A7_9ACTN|nr:class I SAM-dependent methyltransferase [Embleya scabrispora]OPC85319.1 methylase [Embleya scabrispora]